ncbi:glycosyltransferase [Streptomyces sp. NBC_01525]|uniref:glycosyltransferase n=1 Tax=Streptomyces sp. NBC_01525 TaxID=2903893 RepID=UPI00386D961A
MHIGLLTDGAHPGAPCGARRWYDRLVQGLPGHEFTEFALPAPPAARPTDPSYADGARRTGPVPGPAARRADGRGRTPDRAARRRFARHFAELAAALAVQPGGTATQADRFAAGLHGLADLARDHADLPALLRSEAALRLLERACRAPGALPAAHAVQVPDLLAVTTHLDEALRPLSLDWYGDGAPGLDTVDLCHATAAGPTALAGLLAKRFFGTPLLVTEDGPGLRAHHLDRATTPLNAPARALLAAFQRALAAETYARATLITPGTAHARRWQERCGAAPQRLRTVHPGVPAGPFLRVPDAVADGATTLVWAGPVEPAKDLAGLLRAFAHVRTAVPDATLRIVGGPGDAPDAAAYLAHCRALADRLFPGAPGPVRFEEPAAPGAPPVADAYATAAVVVLSGVDEGFPHTLVEAMFSGRATVSTDAGAVCEVIGGTGLVVPAGDPRALADACLALLTDPARRARLGAATRARALELFTVDRHLTAFRGIYLELLAHAHPDPAPGTPHPFARPAETHLPGRRGDAAPRTPPTDRTPSWAAPGPRRRPAATGGEAR